MCREGSVTTENNLFTRMSHLLWRWCCARSAGWNRAEETTMSSFCFSETFEAKFTYEGNDPRAVRTKDLGIHS